MAKVKKQQRFNTRTVVATGGPKPAPPLTITITRIGPRLLDDDNLQGACKAVRDGIADVIGIDDGSDLYTWVYQQRVGNRYGVDVEIISTPPP